MKQKAEYGFIAVLVTLVIAIAGLELGLEVGQLFTSLGARLAAIPHGS